VIGAREDRGFRPLNVDLQDIDIFNRPLGAEVIEADDRDGLGPDLFYSPTEYLARKIGRPMERARLGVSIHMELSMARL